MTVEVVYERNHRAELVKEKCDELFHQLANGDPNVRACVIIVSTLPVEMHNLNHITSDEIGGWGYIIYSGYQGGWIKNNGNRGFENWCVCGYNHQEDNIIYID